MTIRSHSLWGILKYFVRGLGWSGLQTEEHIADVSTHEEEFTSTACVLQPRCTLVAD